MNKFIETIIFELSQRQTNSSGENEWEHLPADKHYVIDYNLSQLNANDFVFDSNLIERLRDIDIVKLYDNIHDDLLKQ